MSVARRRLKLRWGEIGLNIMRSEKKNCAFWFWCVLVREMDQEHRLGAWSQVWPVAGAEVTFVTIHLGWFFSFRFVLLLILSKRIIFEIEHIEQMSTRRNWSWSGRKMSGRVAFYFTFKAEGSDELWTFPGGWRNPCWYSLSGLEGEEKCQKIGDGQMF